MTYQIKRETSKYDKSMKWHLIGIGLNGNKFSSWHRTEKEAIYSKNRYKITKNKFSVVV